MDVERYVVDLATGCLPEPIVADEFATCAAQ
jgi:hypothetical protein